VPKPLSRRFIRFLRRRSGVLVDLVYPSFCPLCGEPSGPGPPRPCTACRARLGVPRPPLCPHCGRAAGPAARRGDPCPGCRRRPFFPGRVAGAFLYRGGGGELVRALKFGGRLEAGLFLARAMARAGRVAAIPRGRGVLYVPVPLHPAKRRRRGLHQSRFLAECLARSTGGRPLDALERIRDTPPQGDPGVLSREANVRDAFAPAGRRARVVAGAAVVLVDDVTTSGATARECARLLRRLGARSVDLLAACLA